MAIVLYLMISNNFEYELCLFESFKVKCGFLDSLSSYNLEYVKSSGWRCLWNLIYDQLWLPLFLLCIFWLSSPIYLLFFFFLIYTYNICFSIYLSSQNYRSSIVRFKKKKKTKQKSTSNSYLIKWPNYDILVLKVENNLEPQILIIISKLKE